MIKDVSYNNSISNWTHNTHWTSTSRPTITMNNEEFQSSTVDPRALILASAIPALAAVAGTKTPPQPVSPTAWAPPPLRQTAPPFQKIKRRQRKYTSSQQQMNVPWNKLDWSDQSFRDGGFHFSDVQCYVGRSEYSALDKRRIPRFNVRLFMILFLSTFQSYLALGSFFACGGDQGLVPIQIQYRRMLRSSTNPWKKKQKNWRSRLKNWNWMSRRITTNLKAPKGHPSTLS